VRTGGLGLGPRGLLGAAAGSALTLTLRVIGALLGPPVACLNESLRDAARLPRGVRLRRSGQDCTIMMLLSSKLDCAAPRRSPGVLFGPRRSEKLRFRTLKSLALLQFQKDAVNNSDCSRVDVILFGLNS
jgi:hypothetical protein